MAQVPPTRVADDVYLSAQAVAAVMSRSTAQQITHWARLGRELEASRSFSAQAIAEVLSGTASYDALDEKEQAIVRTEWAARMAENRAALDLAAEFAASGASYAELDDDGQVVVHRR